MTLPLDQFKVFVTSLLATAQEKVDQFKVAFNDDPAEAMEWSNGAFQGAARLRVYSRVLQRLTAPGFDEKAYCDLLVFIRREVTVRAVNGCHSSSPTSDLMSTETLAAWARLLESF